MYAITNRDGWYLKSYFNLKSEWTTQVNEAKMFINYHNTLMWLASNNSICRENVEVAMIF